MAEPDVSAEECRAQAVAWFLSSEKTIAEIAHTLNLSETTVRQWVWNATSLREAVRRAEAMAAEAIARVEASAAETKTEVAELRAQLEGVRAELEDARAEIAARVTAEAVTPVGTVDAASEPSEPSGPSDDKPRHADEADPEAAALAKIAEVTARAKSVELWVHATGRTLEAAKAEVLDRLGVDEDQAEIEVLATGSRWLQGRVQVRGRVRGRTDLRLVKKKPAGPGPVASAGPGPADGRGEPG